MHRSANATIFSATAALQLQMKMSFVVWGMGRRYVGARIGWICLRLVGRQGRRSFLMNLSVLQPSDRDWVNSQRSHSCNVLEKRVMFACESFFDFAAKTIQKLP